MLLDILVRSTPVNESRSLKNVRRHVRIRTNCIPTESTLTVYHLLAFNQIFASSPGRKTSTRQASFSVIYALCTHDHQRLETQCRNMSIPILSPAPPTDISPLKKALTQSDVILDAIFGFSFQPPVRAPFDTVLPLLTQSKLPIVSVDIPSGWSVENGDEFGVGLQPDVLISLTAPKLGVRGFRGKHFLGGRFVPKCVLMVLLYSVSGPKLKMGYL